MISLVLEHRVTWALMAAIATLIGAYFSFSRDILRELHFIRGQNSFLLKRFEMLDKVQERIAAMDRDADRLKYDLNNAWTKIRDLKGDRNGSSHAKND